MSRRGLKALFSRTPVMSPRDAAQAFDAGQVQLVDVRPPSALAQTRVDGATNIPLEELNERMGELDRERPIAFICRSGQRSGLATQMAVKRGLDASNVEGGVIAWGREGLPLVTGGGR